MGVVSVSPAQCSALQVWLSSLYHLLELITLAWFRAVVHWPAASRVFPPWVGFFLVSGFGGGIQGLLIDLHKVPWAQVAGG